MKNNNLFICLLVDILECAEKEKNAILDGKLSLWNMEQIQKVIIPEISELLYYANKDETLWDIAKKYSTSVDALKKYNDVESERISKDCMILISGK